MKQLTQKWISSEFFAYEDFPKFKQNDLVRFYNGTEGVIDKYEQPFLYLKNSTVNKEHVLNTKEYIIVP